ncbi:hypothetical protein BD770DRAFT_431506 [Pilaira anomala]|nr:hypothetical protein BD770DRAFT_431506 [Pilaira anomala]
MAGGVAMTGVAMNNTGAALVVVVMEILLFVVCWNLKSKGQNGCFSFSSVLVYERFVQFNPGCNGT